MVLVFSFHLFLRYEYKLKGIDKDNISSSPPVTIYLAPENDEFIFEKWPPSTITFTTLYIHPEGIFINLYYQRHCNN